MKRSLNRFLNIILIGMIAALILACSASKIPPPTIINAPESLDSKSTPFDTAAKQCICVQLWMPVCGEDGKTYSNSCFAKCAGVKFKQGSCTKESSD